MSDQDAEALVRKGYQAFQNGDMETLGSLFADNIEWRIPKVEGAPYDSNIRGRQRVMEFFQQLNETEELLLFEPEDFIASGGKVAVTGRSRMKVRATGRISETQWVHIFTLEDGRVVRFFEMFDTAEAQRAFQKAASA